MSAARHLNRWAMSAGHYIGQAVVLTDEAQRGFPSIGSGEVVGIDDDAIKVRRRKVRRLAQLLSPFVEEWWAFGLWRSSASPTTSGSDQ